jgi:uncharacterized protein YraI
MTIGKTSKIAAIAGTILALSIGSAMAAPGYATGNVNVRTGPGTGYTKVDTLSRGEQVQIGQCQGGWCYVSHSGPDGWVSANYLSQGSGYTPKPRPTPNNDNPSVGFSFGFGSDGSHFGFSFGNQGRPGWTPPQPRACFYTGKNYTGKSVCVTAGTSKRFVGNVWNDKVSSVRLYNGASVTMCQHSNYGGFCRTSSHNEPALGPWLNNKISSVRVN